MSEAVYLLDGNVLVSLYLDDHPHHNRTLSWLASRRRQPLASCSVTEGTLLRMHMMHARDKSPQAAWDALHNLHERDAHQFWDDGFSYKEIDTTSIQGHRQITDAWLVELARRNGGRLATLDVALATLHPEIAELIPMTL